MDVEEDCAPPPSMPCEQRVHYYYMTAAHAPRAGPCTLAQLQVLWSSGQIAKDTLLWREGLAEWAQLQSLPEVAGPLLRLKQPPVLAVRQSW